VNRAPAARAVARNDLSRDSDLGGRRAVGLLRQFQIEIWAKDPVLSGAPRGVLKNVLICITLKNKAMHFSFFIGTLGVRLTSAKKH